MTQTTTEVVDYLNGQFIQDIFPDADRLTVMNFLIGFSDAIRKDMMKQIDGAIYLRGLIK